jgi:CRISPR-associated exonuclease Cas4
MSELVSGLGWLSVAMLLAILSLVAWLVGRAGRKLSGLPSGAVIYDDMGEGGLEPETIYSPGLGLAGRPDYLLQDDDGSVVPVEVKSADAPAEPYDGHVLQLAAYCLLVEEAYGIRPSYGILQYRDGAFTVDFTYELEADLLDLLETMREDALAGEVDRDHDDPARCANCGFLSYCDQRVVEAGLL